MHREAVRILELTTKSVRQAGSTNTMPASTSDLRELGSRVRARREEARLDLRTLAERARLRPDQLDAFEAGAGGLGLAELLRVANVLGVPSASFAHTSAPIVRANVEPSIVLRGSGASWLPDGDCDALINGLRRARAFAEVGELLNAERVSDQFRATPPPTDRPFLHGAEVAKRVRALIPERDGPIEGLARLLEERFNILVLRYRFADPRVLGAACRSGEARLVAVNTAMPAETTRRFTLAHELGHHVLDLEESGATADEAPDDLARFWLDNPPREKRANAFAAMLLASDDVVAALVGPPQVGLGYEGAKHLVDRVRAHVGMGFAATAWHLHNLRYFDEGMASMLLVAEPDADRVEGFESDTPYDGLQRRVFDALNRGLISLARARELLGDDEGGDANLGA